MQSERGVARNPILRTFLSVRLDMAKSGGKPEQVAALGERLGRSNKEKGLDLIETYGVLEARARSLGNNALADKYEGVIHDTYKLIFSPDNS